MSLQIGSWMLLGPFEAWAKSRRRYSRREWRHPLHAHESYPGVTEPGWVSAHTGEPEPDWKCTHASKLNNSHSKVLEVTGPKFVIDDLRHTFATKMAERGMDLATLASILGHSGIRSVQKYVHITQRHQDAAVRRYGYLESEAETRAKEAIQ